MGKSASGKDTLYQKLLCEESLGLRRVVPYTTRPMRAGEKDGMDYHFADETLFLQMKRDGQIIESRTYHTVQGDWTYFTADDGQIDLETGSSLLVGTLEVYVRLQKHFGTKNVVPLYIEVEDGERLSRALVREKRQKKPDYAELCRRYLADMQDFSEENLAQAGICKRYNNQSLEACLQELCRDIRRINGEAQTTIAGAENSK